MRGIQGRRGFTVVRSSGVGVADTALDDGEAVTEARRLRQASEQ